MSRCAALGCDSRAVDGPLCGLHADRLEQGLGLPTWRDLRVVGEASGHGQWGLVDRTDSGVLCHECGQRFASLGIHLARVHDITTRAYRHRHGLPAKASLALRGTSEQPRRRPHPCGRCGTELTDPGKLCGDCRIIRRQEAEARRAAELKPRPRRERWRLLTDDERDQLASTPSDDLAVLVETLQRDRVTSAEIGTVLGRSPKWMARRHPRPGWGHATGEATQAAP